MAYIKEMATNLHLHGCVFCLSALVISSIGCGEGHDQDSEVLLSESMSHQQIELIEYSNNRAQFVGDIIDVDSATRDSVTRLDLSDLVIDEPLLEQLVGFQRLEILYLRNCELTDQALINLGELLNLKLLILSQNNLSDDAIKKALNGKRIRELYLDYTSVSYAGLIQIAKNKNLKTLGIAGCDISTYQISDLKQKYPDIKIMHGARAISDEELGVYLDHKYTDHINISGNPGNHSRVTKSGLELLAEIEQLKYVTYEYANIDEDEMQALSNVKNLLYISVRHSNFDEESLEVLYRHEKLVEIDISDTVSTGAALGHIDAASRLRWIRMANTNVTSSSMSRLSAKQLDLLDLSNTSVRWHQLGSLARRIQIDNLILRGTEIDNSDLQILKQISGLRSLVLSSTDVGDEHVQDIVNIKGLERLDISGTRISGRYIEKIAAMNQMMQLILHQSLVSEARINKCAAKYPNVQFDWAPRNQ